MNWPKSTSTTQGTNLLAYIWGQVPVVYDYDNNANTVSANNRTFVYDLSNQPIRVLDGSNQIAEYTYNGAGQRIKKWTPTETRIFHYDLQGYLIAETNQSGGMLTEYIYIGDQLLAMIKPGQPETVYYFHNDHLGTPQVLMKDSQNIVWKAAYTPFGGAAISIQTVENPFRLAGRYYDQETGLHYNYFRYYDPATGRYVTPDPIGLEGGINLFAYANNPIRFIDPDGNQEWNIFPDLPIFKSLPRLPSPIDMCEGITKGIIDQSVEKHHLFPEEFKEWFKNREIDIEKYTIPMEQGPHRLKEDEGLHTGKGEENGNKNWRDYKEKHEDATNAQMYDHLRKMMKDFGIEGYRVTRKGVEPIDDMRPIKPGRFGLDKKEIKGIK